MIGLFQDNDVDTKVDDAEGQAACREGYSTEDVKGGGCQSRLGAAHNRGRQGGSLFIDPWA